MLTSFAANYRACLLFILIPILLMGCGEPERKSESGQPVPIPETEEIERMQVFMEGLNRLGPDGYRKRADEVNFIVPRSHWAGVLKALQPLRRERCKAKGYCPGSIMLTLKNETRFRISIVASCNDDGELEVSLGPDAIRHMGGSKQKLYTALRAAQLAQHKME